MSSSAPGSLFIVSAPSGGGKTSLTRGAIGPLGRAGVTAEISISYTTRRPRPGEQDGVHYFFVERPQFKAMAAAGEFLEHAEIYGEFYGTARSRTEALLAQGRDVILDIDWQGARQIKAAVADAVTIFILPPSLELLEQRLRARRQDSDESIARRLKQAREEIAHHAEYDFLIINSEFDQAMAELLSIFVARRLRRPVQQLRHKSLIDKLLSANPRD